MKKEGRQKDNYLINNVSSVSTFHTRRIIIWVTYLLVSLVDVDGRRPAKYELWPFIKFCAYHEFCFMMCNLLYFI